MENIMFYEKLKPFKLKKLFGMKTIQTKHIPMKPTQEKTMEWEKKMVGKNIHSVYVFCRNCSKYGTNFPLDKECGNCGSHSTNTYYDDETISILLASSQDSFRRKVEDEVIGAYEVQNHHYDNFIVSEHSAFLRNELRTKQRAKLKNIK